jgi:NAD(P)-dependent dehydrogenase (short-subunit alcohol dehydrogenase family)
VTYRREEEFMALREASGVRATALADQHVDVTNDDAVHRLVEEIMSQHGRLDVLVNAVGEYAGGTPSWDVDPSNFQLTIIAASGGEAAR